ncbi:MAG: hypothetical protein NVSMB65_00450 [Chloroflexota bacterium]
MSVTPLVPELEEALPRLSAPEGLLSWVSSVDHKQIGIMYLLATFVFFLLGGVEAMLIRLQLAQPNNGLLQPDSYNQAFTMHGTTMIFLVIMPMLIGFSTYFVPLMIGANDMAFPRLNALSFWLLLAAGIVFYASIFFNPPEAGWSSYAPLSNSIFSPSGRAMSRNWPTSWMSAIPP